MLLGQRTGQRTALRPWKLAAGRVNRPASTGVGNPFRTAGKKPSPPTQSRRAAGGSPPASAPAKTPWELLFPEESKRWSEQQQAGTRTVPLLPLEVPPVPPPVAPPEPPSTSRLERQIRKQSDVDSPATSVLVLRNASTNLVAEDFRRLVPPGKHLDGWTLDQGDILAVFPARDLSTLAHLGVYFLLFSSPLSAFTFQGHVHKIHDLAQLHTPSSVTSPIPPPPGHMIQGLDAHAAIEAYALLSPSQRPVLRQLRHPMSPTMKVLVKHRGHPSLVHREGKMPFEARLTLEGAQLSPSIIQHILRETGRDRGLSWSGGEEMGAPVTKWDPEESRTDFAATDVQPASVSRLKQRTPPAVYIVGFHTEAAVQSFIQHWHRRPMQWPIGANDVEGDLPPTANVELLW